VRLRCQWIQPAIPYRQHTHWHWLWHQEYCVLTQQGYQMHTYSKPTNLWLNARYCRSWAMEDHIFFGMSYFYCLLIIDSWISHKYKWHRIIWLRFSEICLMQNWIPYMTDPHIHCCDWYYSCVTCGLICVHMWNCCSIVLLCMLPLHWIVQPSCSSDEYTDKFELCD